MRRSPVLKFAMFVLFFYLNLDCFSDVAVAQDAKAAAEKSATIFLNGVDNLDPALLYDKATATRAKAYLTKEAFVQWINVFRIQAGGAVQSRLLIGSTPMAQLANGEKGDFYYVRYREAYPAAQTFVDVILEHEGQSWLVVWYNFAPAPAQ
jgi:hypothetical protein